MQLHVHAKYIYNIGRRIKQAGGQLLFTGGQNFLKKWKNFSLHGQTRQAKLYSQLVNFPHA